MPCSACVTPGLPLSRAAAHSRQRGSLQANLVPSASSVLQHLASARRAEAALSHSWSRRTASHPSHSTQTIASAHGNATLATGTPIAHSPLASSTGAELDSPCMRGADSGCTLAHAPDAPPGAAQRSLPRSGTAGIASTSGRSRDLCVRPPDAAVTTGAAAVVETTGTGRADPHGADGDDALDADAVVALTLQLLSAFVATGGEGCHVAWDHVLGALTGACYALKVPLRATICVRALRLLA